MLPGYHGLSPALAGRHIQDNKGNVRMSSNTGGWEKFHVPFAQGFRGRHFFDGEMMQGELMVSFPKAIRPHLYRRFFFVDLGIGWGLFCTFVKNSTNLCKRAAYPCTFPF